MGVFTRPDSPYWWLWLETAPKGQQKVRTDIFVGDTPDAKRGSKVHARRVYAEKMLAANAASVDQDAKPTVRFGAYADTYARDVISHHKGADREREILAVLRLAFRDLELHEVTRDAVRQWMTERRAAGVSAATVNREVDLLKAMVRDAVPRYLEASPLRGMARLKTIQPRRRVLSADEERRLLKACEDAQDTALLVLGIDTLQRMGDLLDLQRTDRHKQWIYIRDNKSGEALDVPLSPRAAKALDAITHDDPHYFVKFQEGGEPARLAQLRPTTARVSLPAGGRAIREGRARDHLPLGDQTHGRDEARGQEESGDSHRAGAGGMEESGCAIEDLHRSPAGRLGEGGRPEAQQEA
jgi:integrase